MEAPNPFAPSSMTIHPLTRVDRTPGSAAIICHIEFKDAWSDPCKALGKLRVELFQALSDDARTGRQELVWESDLSDLDRNANHYDQATRTYRLSLDGVPEEMVALGAVRIRCRLRAMLDGPDAKGRPQRLMAEYVLDR